ncbi:YraN family protein [Ruminococcaceae bacterium OttesenSCG-928-L11]|nr:YraN family protein [Ruminococcaceae bacterium OttesenSCG-928-L11]
MNPRGRRGEEFAVRTLVEEGLRILAVNYHSRYGEVDIIATDGESLCFVEVKTRKEGSMVPPEQAVPLSKQRKIIKTALQYMGESELEYQPRFDLFAVVTGSGGEVTAHDWMKGAFDGDAYQGC